MRILLAATKASPLSIIAIMFMVFDTQVFARSPAPTAEVPEHAGQVCLQRMGAGTARTSR